MIHRHLYEHAGDLVEQDRGEVSVRYQDWKCIREGCRKMKRCYYSHPPGHRLPGGIPSLVEAERAFGASDA